MLKLPITVIIAARNEAINLPKCLRALNSIARVVVVDSGSSDETVETSLSFGAEVLQFTFAGGYPKKRQWALDTLSIDTPWVLLLDADEVIPSELLEEIEKAIASPSSPSAFLITKGFHFLGKRMRFGGFSHSAVLLFRTGCARFEHLIDEPSTAMDMEVHERLIVDGEVGRLRAPLIHDDWKGLEAYIDRHNKYSTWEAKVRFRALHDNAALREGIKPSLFGDVQQRRRLLKLLAMRVPFEPWLWFVYHYFVRLGFMEGRRGFVASQIRSQYIANVRSKIWQLQNAR